MADLFAPLPYEIAAAVAEPGEPVPIGAWAEWANMRSGTGRRISAAAVERATGLRSKSWSPERFRDLAPVIDTARRALEAGGIHARDVDALIVVSCTPYESGLDQDAFAILRTLGLPQHVPPLVSGAGCAGLARAMRLIASMASHCALICCYNVPSALGSMPDGTLNPIYNPHSNPTHSWRDSLWLTAALFSDAAASLVLLRRPGSPGAVFYTRDSSSFGGGPAFTNPLIHRPGGGAARPPGTPGAEQLAAYGMDGAALAEYYTRGMLLNHAATDRHWPGYVQQVRRIYTHQANPALVQDFVRLAELPPDLAPSHARERGNHASVSTAVLLAEDLQDGTVKPGDEVCVSVVGAGPERGVFLLPLGGR